MGPTDQVGAAGGAAGSCAGGVAGFSDEAGGVSAGGELVCAKPGSANARPSENVQNPFRKTVILFFSLLFVTTYPWEEKTVAWWQTVRAAFSERQRKILIGRMKILRMNLNLNHLNSKSAVGANTNTGA